MEGDKIHFLTEAIYRNLLDNYSPGLKQFISTGRAYQKALHNVASAGKSYVDCIFSLSQGAQRCKGATAEIGASLVQIAEVLKEINVQIVDNIKTFHAEVLIPLESKQDMELKQLQVLHKKYQSGHKYHATALDKSTNALKKHKKKTKNKYGFDQKELQHSRQVKECQAQMEEYHLTCLKTVLIEERRRYCKLLEHMCSTVRSSASHHSKAHELLTHRLPEWSDTCKNPHFLPDTSEAIIRAFKAQQEDVYSTTEDMADMRRRASLEYGVGGGGGESLSMTYGTLHRMGLAQGDDNHHHPHPNHQQQQQIYGGSTVSGQQEEQYAVAGLARSVSVLGGPRQQVRATYSHTAASETQISFREGDVITLIGEVRHGWQYGECMRTGAVGWFPLTFTETLHTGSADATISLANQRLLAHHRVRSMGNLHELLTDDNNITSSSAYHIPTTSASQPAPPGSNSQPPVSSHYSDSDSGHGRDLERHHLHQAGAPLGAAAGDRRGRWEEEEEEALAVPPPPEFQDPTPPLPFINYRHSMYSIRAPSPT